MRKKDIISEENIELGRCAWLKNYESADNYAICNCKHEDLNVCNEVFSCPSKSVLSTFWSIF